MKFLIDRMLEDLSTKDIFLFRIACGVCETEFANIPRRFSKAGIAPRTEGKKILFDAVYAQEYRSAKQSAVREAAEQLNYCPICRRLVCNRCFLICNDLDMCRQCAVRLEETGSPVFSDVPEAEI